MDRQRQDHFGEHFLTPGNTLQAPFPHTVIPPKCRPFLKEEYQIPRQSNKKHLNEK
ncbi:hypothetical protein GMO_01950 [Gluconobacter morbifer G707]|uniref:Uncharacterized protein n=1 Tax=Gluconobacter morbifer G707 TaxID=1088869 RepID=G6XFD0_9PROT|nr:hypothetical protein GMO_01950 [Gluconobacter morbifer G707]